LSLPDSWIDKLFRKLSATYGQAFLRQYDGVPMDDVKANWAHELSCYQQTPQAISRGLDRLPSDRAPTVLQFRELCRGQAEHDRLALPAPPKEPVTPEVLAATKAAFQRKDERGWRDWAHALRRRHESGEKLTRFQVKAYRETLGIGQEVA
jgi:hypothetical protein